MPCRLDRGGAKWVAIRPRGTTYPLVDRPDRGEVSEREVFIPSNSYTW